MYMFIVKASYFRCNCLMLKKLKELAACIHAWSLVFTAPTAIHVKELQGSFWENYIPYLQSDNRPLPTTAGIPTYSRQKDGRRICHPGLSCIHCMHGYIVCKRCMDIYTYVKLDLLWWLTLHGRTGWSHMLDQMHVLRSWGLKMYSYGPCIHATACDLSNSKNACVIYMI